MESAVGMETGPSQQAGVPRAVATALLNDGLLRTLETTGPVHVVGSYALDLMVRPDLDFTLELPHELAGV